MIKLSSCFSTLLKWVVMKQKLFRLFEYRFFLDVLVKKEFKIRYSQSVLGMSWLIIEPLITVLTFSVIFTLIGRKGPHGAPFPVFFYSGLVIWNFFNSCLTSGVKSFINDQALWTKLDFPRAIIIIKNIVVYCTDMILALIPVVPIFLYYGYFPNIKYLILIPLFGLVAIFGLGIMLLFASLNVYFRDIGILVRTLSTIWFWFTPIIFHFPEEGVIKLLYYINPMAGVVITFRKIILLNEFPEWSYLISILSCSILFFIVGYLSYKRLQRGFADVV